MLELRETPVVIDKDSFWLVSFYPFQQRILFTLKGVIFYAIFEETNSCLRKN